MKMMLVVAIMLGLTAGSIPSVADGALTEGLVAHWSFDHDFTSSVGGMDYYATPVNGAFIISNGRFGNAAGFIRNLGQYLQVPSPVVTPGQDHTYSAWYKTTWTTIGNLVDRYFIMETTGIGGTTAVTVSYGLRDIQGDGLDTQGEVWTEWAGGYTNGHFDHPDEDQWHNIIVTYDADQAQQKIYFDGALALTLASSNPLLDTAGLIIGGHRGGTGRNWDGWIDDIGFWDRILTPAEIADLQTGAILAPADWTASTYTPLTDSGNCVGVAWADYNGDGRQDLYLANSGQANKLFRNLGGGRFTDATSGYLGDAGDARGAAWGDYDNDGDLDLYLANYGPNKLLSNDGDGSFSDATIGDLGDTGSGEGVAWCDYDSDGNLDLYLVIAGAANKLLHNEGDGTFVNATSGPLGDTGNGVGVAWGDYDNDGDQDLYLSKWGQADKLLRNDGGGAFVDVTSDPLGDTGQNNGVAWGDFDNDGDLDLYLSNYGGANKLLRNEGDGSFTDATNGPLGDTANSVGVAWGDFDNDGYLDLYLANAGQANKLFRNEGAGVFTDATSGPLGNTAGGRGVAWGDCDNDGDLDLYLANADAANALFYNDAAGGNRWLHVNLLDAGSAPNGIGARVYAYCGGQMQMREVSGGSGYLSQDSLTQEFGLGTATVVDSLVVEWPSGERQVEYHVAVNQVITLDEPRPLNGSEKGLELAQALGMGPYIIGVYPTNFSISAGGTEAINAAAWANPLEKSVLLTSGRASDGGLGNTDWGEDGTSEWLYFRMSINIPAGANSLRFDTQLISAEYDAGRLDNDSVEMQFEDLHSYVAPTTNVDLNELTGLCAGPKSAVLTHTIDLTDMYAPRQLTFAFTIFEGTDGDHDTALRIANMHFSGTILPPPEEECWPYGMCFIMDSEPRFHDVSLTAGSYTYDKDILEIPGTMPLRFGLTYNSDSVRLGRLGPKWTHGYDLHLLKLTNSSVAIRHGNGQTTYFKPDGLGGFLPTYTGSHATLTETSADHYSYVAESNLTYEFSPLAAWNDYGQLDVVRDANGNETIFTHSAVSDRLHERIDQISVGTNVVQFTYTMVDTVELITQIDINGNPVAGFAYDATGHMRGIDEYTTVGSKSGPSHTAITSDGEGRILTVTNGAGETEVSNTYSGTVLVSQTDAAGSASTTEYDQERLIHHDRLGQQTIRTYDIDGQLVELEHPGGGIATYGYDDDGNMSSMTDALGAVTTMVYDIAGNMTSRTDGLGNTRTMTYDSRGNLLTQTDPDGNTSTYTYDAADNVLTETDPVGNTKVNTYNLAGQLETTTDAMGNTTSYQYDANGFLNQTTDAMGGVTRFLRDDFGHPTSITDPHGNTTLSSYTVDGRLLSMTDPLGGGTTRTYDGAGRVLTETTQNAPYSPITTTWTYTTTGQVASLTNGAGLTTTFEYDAVGQRTKVTDSLGRATSFVYDDEGRVVSVVDAAGGAAQAGYSACSRLTVTDPAGNTTSYHYDALGRVDRETDPLGNSVLYSYDSRGLIATMTNSRLQTFSYTYDPVGRLTGESFPGGSITHSLDANGNETSTTGAFMASVARNFDELDRLESRQDVYGRTVQYEYDSIGNVTAVVYPDGARVGYGYDALGRLVSVTDWNNNVTSYSYAQGGDLASIDRPDLSRVTYEYDSGQRLVAVTDSAGVGGTTIFSADFILNEADQRIVASLSLPLEPVIDDVYQQMEHSANRLDSVDGQAYVYDGDGNLVQGMIGGSLKTMDIDPLGRLTRCGDDFYDYDTDGYRVATLIGGVERQYVYDVLNGTPRLLAEYDGSGALVARYVHGLGLISREDSGGEMRYYHRDTRGSTVALTRADGTMSDRYAYGPFGAVLARDGSTENPFLFCGGFGVMDDGNGLYLMRARYYAPELMRFVQRDQAYSGGLERTQTLNRYAYAEGNPILNIDPNGMWSLKKAWKATKKKVTKAAMSVANSDLGISIANSDFGDWVYENRQGIARVTAVVAGITAGVAATAACGGNILCGIAAGYAVGTLVGNSIGGGIDEGKFDKWQWTGYGAFSELINADYKGGWNYMTNAENFMWVIDPIYPLVYGDSNNSGSGVSGQHGQMNDFRPARDGFDGQMSQAREARMNAWVITGSVCPLQK